MVSVCCVGTASAAARTTSGMTDSPSHTSRSRACPVSGCVPIFLSLALRRVIPRTGHPVREDHSRSLDLGVGDAARQVARERLHGSDDELVEPDAGILQDSLARRPVPGAEPGIL